MKIRYLLFILILLMNPIQVLAQDIYPDLNLIMVQEVPTKTIYSVSNISNSDYNLIIVSERTIVHKFTEIINEFYPLVNHSQISLSWILKGKYDSDEYNILKESYNMTYGVYVTLDSTDFDIYMKYTGIYVMLYDVINHQIIKAQNHLLEEDLPELLMIMDELSITFTTTPIELSNSIYQKNPKKTFGFEIYIILPLILVVWKRKDETNP